MKKYKVVGKLGDEWSDRIEDGFVTEQEAEDYITELKNSKFDSWYDDFTTDGGHIWVEEDN
jgi:hypothetical protein